MSTPMSPESLCSKIFGLNPWKGTYFLALEMSGKRMKSSQSWIASLKTLDLLIWARPFSQERRARKNPRVSYGSVSLVVGIFPQVQWALLPDVWPCALWSLGAGAAAGRCCQMCGRVRFGAWVLVPLQGAAARCVAACAVELGCWCRCRALLPDVWPCALCSLGAGAAAGRCCRMCGRVRCGAWVLVPLQGAAGGCVAVCAVELGCWCRCRALLPDVWPCALWSLGAGAATGRCCQMCGRVRCGAWVLVPLQGAAARCVAVCAVELGCWCRCRALLPDVWPCALWSLGAGAATGRCCQMCGRVRCGAWVLVPLQGAAARCVAVCAVELGCWCRCWVPHVWPCALWSLCAGAAGRCVAVCALELGCWCFCRVPLPDVGACALWSLGAGAAAGQGATRGWCCNVSFLYALWSAAECRCNGPTKSLAILRCMRVYVLILTSFSGQPCLVPSNTPSLRRSGQANWGSIEVLSKADGKLGAACNIPERMMEVEVFGELCFKGPCHPLPWAISKGVSAVNVPPDSTSSMVIISLSNARRVLPTTTHGTTRSFPVSDICKPERSRHSEES